MTNETDNLDTLINDLSDDLSCVTPCKHPLALMFIWITIALTFVASTVIFMGLRPDIITKVNDSIFLLEISLSAAIALSAGASAFYLRVPDRCGAKWVGIVPYTLFSVFISWTIIQIIAEGIHMPDFHWVHCASDSGIFVSIPLAVLTFITAKRSATTKRFTMMAMQAMAVGGLGYIALRLTCIMDTMGHDLVYHMLPFLVLGIIVGLIAHRLYRW